MEEIITAEREELDNIGVADVDLLAFTRFKLKFLEARLDLYSEPKFRRLTFESYIRRRQVVDQMVHKYCSSGRTLVFYGDSSIHSNSPMKG